MKDEENEVLRAIEQGRDELSDLACDLIRFDTTTREDIDSLPREEVAFQDYLARRLRSVGADVEVWEPTPLDVAGSRQVPAGIDFRGFPQMVARFAGKGGGRNLIFNGHIDVVPAGPRENWTTDPNMPEVREDRLYGRGACDMKGGIAAMVFTAEILATSGVTLGGDLMVSTTTDEESTSAGGVATVAHGLRADAAIVTEPTSLNVGIACRGSLLPTIVVHGRAGHAGGVQAHWRDGGAVSAVERMTPIIDAVYRLRQEWRDRPDHRHDYLPPGDAVATMVRGGDWVVTHAASCELCCHLTYLPAHADAAGYGTLVEAEFSNWILRSSAADPWLADHPPVLTWGVDVPPSEVATDDPVVEAVLDSTSDLALDSRPVGNDYWCDGATFTRSGTPAVTFGPGSVRVAHTADEYVPVQELVDCAKGLALSAMRFCATTT